MFPAALPWQGGNAVSPPTDERTKMQALSVVAHPTPTSFSHAMARAANEALRDLGYIVNFHDLYAEGFDPIHAVGEAQNIDSTDPLVELHCGQLANADIVLVFHPNWWSQPPAILKGWIDRVFRLNTAYGYPPGAGLDGEPIGLLRANAAFVFNTSNTPLEREHAIFGDPLHSIWSNSVFGLCGVKQVVRRMYGPMASSTDAQRRGWLHEVKQLVGDQAAQSPRP